MTETATDMGWLFLAGWRKAHYFRGDRRSLCGKWGAHGHPLMAFSPEDPAFGAAEDDCAACRRKLDKQGVR